ncbi:MAG: hypothetical protein AAF352_04695, partial [Pseudomonadota bacterium]
MRAAIYRFHYYVETLPASIAAIRDLVDHIFIFWSPISWAGLHQPFPFGNKIYRVPPLHEDIGRILHTIPNADGKIKIVRYETKSAFQSFNLFFDHIKKYYKDLNHVALLEADMILDPETISKLDRHWKRRMQCFTTVQINLWQNTKYYMPRARGTHFSFGPIFYDLSSNDGKLWPTHLAPVPAFSNAKEAA